MHSGGIEVSNDCYDVRLTNFYIQNFGDADQSTVFDVLAKTKADGTDEGRTEQFTLDLFGSFTTVNHHAVKVRSGNLLLGSDGADEFNQLTTGSTSGPFSVGEQAGKARTSVRLLYCGQPARAPQIDTPTGRWASGPPSGGGLAWPS